jgi:type II secretory pathway predicted ATPase ExeA
MSRDAKAYKLEFKPLVLKRLVLDCDITQTDLADAAGVSRPTVNLCINRGYVPITGPDAFKQAIEDYVLGHAQAMKWLEERQLEVEDIWDTEKEGQRRHSMPRGTGRRTRNTRDKPVVGLGDPMGLKGKKGHSYSGLKGGPDHHDWMEVVMVSQEALKHFKVFRNPFIDDIQKETDIYMSDEHRYIEMAMLDAAHHGGFLAVIGECGSGKSVMRRKVVGELKKDGDVRVIFPQIIDKTRMNASAVCDAIIMDLSEQKPKMKLEQKTRQVYQLLLERSKEGYRSVLVIEEAHDLTVSTLKHLKRFYEFEDGFRKLLGIILIGQIELFKLLDEATHVEMREVIRRIQIAEVKGLNGNVKDYLALKFKRVGAKVEDIFTDDGIAALSGRMTKQDRNQKKLSHAYPLVVNNYAARAMNRAYEMGEEKVTADVVNKS